MFGAPCLIWQAGSWQPAVPALPTHLDVVGPVATDGGAGRLADDGIGPGVGAVEHHISLQLLGRLQRSRAAARVGTDGVS